MMEYGLTSLGDRQVQEIQEI